MIGSRSWFALMRRNVLYRRRHWISTILEVFLPVFFVIVLFLIRNASIAEQKKSGKTSLTYVPELVPSWNLTFSPFTFGDYVLALRVQRVCIPGKGNSTFEITGILNKGKSWPVPFVKCDARLCDYVGQNAVPFCEFPILAVAPYDKNSDIDRQRSADFMKWLYRTYPILRNTTNRLRSGASSSASPTRTNQLSHPPNTLPLDHDFIQLFRDSSDIDRYVKLPDYGRKNNPKIALAVVWGKHSSSEHRDEASTKDTYVYSIRQNSTNYNSPPQGPNSKVVVMTTPDTRRLFLPFAKTDREVCTLPNGDIPNLGTNQHSCTAQYMYNGVLAIQRLINDFILYDSGSVDAGFFVSTSGVSITQMPTPAFFLNGFFATIQETMMILLILGLVFPMATMISYVVQEKEYRQKELMKMMSVVESDIGTSWFMTFFVLHIVTGTACTIASGILFEYSSPSFLLILWQCMLICTILFAMVCSTFTSRANRAVLIGVLLYFSGIFFGLAVDTSTMSMAVLQLACLHPVAAFSFALKEISRNEDRKLGITFDTAWSSPDNLSGFTFMTSIRFLILDIFLYSFLTWYLNRVIPPGGNNGQALKPWFIFQQSYWFPKGSRTQRSHLETCHDNVLDDDGTDRSENGDGVTGQGKEQTKDGIPMEPVPPTLMRQQLEGKCIVLKNLRKVFGKKADGVAAVDNLSLTMYNGQVTALLGHNGAGKTTTINMLTGAFLPTSGSANIIGYDIQTQMDTIRQNIGICFQHDCLFPQLTVKEHLRFYARLKGMHDNNDSNKKNNNNNTKSNEQQRDNNDMERDINQTLRDVGLYEKRNTCSKNLSGGMKRKLSVAIAFCGGSKVVLLDEPTSGMDPFSRRFTWNVIRQYRKDRCIILTTHFMDEADVLGDRIAIMAEGKLRCCGSSLFLKRYYGVGYQLTISVNPSGMQGPLKSQQQKQQHQQHNNHNKLISQSSTDSLQEKEQLLKLKQIVQVSVPESIPLSDVGTELSYQLPVASAPKFPSMFEELDTMVQGGMVSSYGISITTLEEVFLLVTRGEDKDTSAMTSGDTPNTNGNTLGTNMTNENQLASGQYRQKHDDHNPNMALEERPLVLFGRHVYALTRKRILYFKRDKSAWICTTIVPCLFVFIGFLIFTLVGQNTDMQPLTLRLEDYNVDAKSSPPQNPIFYNSPSNPYHCSPGICTYKAPNIKEDVTNENYLYCGMASKLLFNTATGYDYSNVTCTVPWTKDIMDSMSVVEPSANPMMANVTTVLESSEALLATSKSFAATQYGAIWFTHLPNSTVPGNKTYRASVIEQCTLYLSTFNYSKPEDCYTFGGVGYLVVFNFTALHATPMFVTLADEAIARYATNNSNLRIITTIAPLPITSDEEKVGAAEDAITAWFLVILSFPFIAGAYASFVVSEKSSKAKHLQTVAGVKPFAYWLSTYIWDTLNYQIPLWITVGLMFAFKVNVLTTSERNAFHGILSILVLYGPASAGFTYCITFAFMSASLCNVFVIISGFLIGLGGPLVCFILQVIAADPLNPNPNFAVIAKTIANVLRITPPFCLGKGLFNVINIEAFAFIENKPNIDAWDEAILLYEVYALAISCVLYPIVAVIMDVGYTNPSVMWYLQWLSPLTYVTIIKRCFYAQNNSGGDSLNAQAKDDDVVAEQNRVASGQANQDLIVIQKITKVYPTGKKAVDGLSLAIPPGQCFGLLGINGAGKTTTMGILTAEFPPSYGDAILAGHSVSRNPQKIRRRIGYCPQFDAHFPNLTGREHVELYASIKGISAKLVKEVASKKLEDVGLSVYDSNRLSSDYSGGMKRRLSLACATVGSPQIVMLDEPSTGVDPVSRREIWHMIGDIVKGVGLKQSMKPCVVLTTHSMDECEALCPRIGIMANGKLSCLGSAQHLKDKFGKGYQIEITTKTVKRNDSDSRRISDILYKFPVTPKQTDAYMEDDVKNNNDETNATPAYFNVNECQAALQIISGDTSISDTIRSDDPIGHSIWSVASSPFGVSADELSAFATSMLRITNVGRFMTENFPNHVVREQQDCKIRYEIDRDGVKIAHVFATIEEKKNELMISDYSVSQTSLEQVFNLHAATAERYKAQQQLQ